MESSIIKDVCAEVTCLHTSGLRKVAVVALGQTAAVGGGVNVGPTEQGSVSKSHSQVKSSAYCDDVFPSQKTFIADVVQGKIGQWSYSARPIFLDRFFPTTQELESLNNFERERILGTSNYDTVVFLHPALKVSSNGGEAVCDICRQPWIDREFHLECIRSEQVQRCQIDDDHKILGSRRVEGERRSWRLVHTSDTIDGTEFRCGNCGFSMGESCDQFVRHALEFCPRFSCTWDQEFKVVKEPGGRKFKSWTMQELRVLWRCLEISKLSGESGWKERMESAWRGAEMRDVSIGSLVNKVREIRLGKLTRLERENIRRKVRRQYLFKEAIQESVEDIVEDDIEETENEEPVTFEQWKEEGNEELLEDIHFDVSGNDEQVQEPIIIDDRDVWSSGETVRPVNDEEKALLGRLREVFRGKRAPNVPSLKLRDQKKVMEQIYLINGIVGNVSRQCESISDVNHLLYACSFVVAERMGLTKKGKGERKAKEEPWWKRRIERNIGIWRKDLSQLEELKRGRWNPSSADRKRLDQKYDLTLKGANEVCSVLKLKIHSSAIKIQKSEDRKLQFHQNKLFRSNQSNFYDELNGKLSDRDDPQVPKAKEAMKFWSDIWSKPEEHAKDAEWLARVKRKLGNVGKQEDLAIDVDAVRSVTRKLSNWKAPGPDGVVGFWFKKISALHDVLATKLQLCLNSGKVPLWMVKGRTVLIQKDPKKGIAASNYRPIACLPIMWKVLTGIFADKIYDHLAENDLLPDEQKGCRKNSRGTKDQLLIDKAITKDARSKGRCLNMAWVDYKKAYDMVPHSWILEATEMMGVADNVRLLLRQSMSHWKTMLSAGNQNLGTVDINRGIFQGDSLSPLLFIMIMTPLSMLLNEERKGYKLGDSGRLVNHLLFMDDLKLYGKSQDEVDALLGLVQEYSNDIGMEFGMDKCAVLGIKNGKRVECKGVVLPSGDVMKDVDEDGYKYLGVLQNEVQMNREMKEKIEKEYLRRVKLLARSKLYAGNLIRGINAWAIGVVRYTAGILDWTEGDLKKMDVKTRKILSMAGAFHTRGSSHRLYIKRKEGGKGLIRVEDCVKMERANLKSYLSDSEEWLLKEVAAMDLVKGVESAADYKKRIEAERKETLRSKPLHGKFFNIIEELAEEGVVDLDRSWQWLKAGFLTKSTEGFIMAAQEQALRTKGIKASIDKVEGEDGLCRLCGKFQESVQHIVSSCGELAKKQYTIRHDKMGSRIHWELCRKYGIKCEDKWFNHVPSTVCSDDNGNIEIF